MKNMAFQAALHFLDSWLDFRVRQCDIPGVAVAIVQGRKLVFSRAYGVADVAHQRALTTGHLFCAGSQSKMLTATALLQLAEQGRLRLDAAACTYLPWLRHHPDPRACRITARQLLNHTSGLMRDGFETDFWRLAQPFPNEPTLRKLALTAEITHDPGTKPKYSNLGFSLLGLVIERASGLRFGEYVRQWIIAPLQLDGTMYPDYEPAIGSRTVTGYGIALEHHRSPFNAWVPMRTFAPVAGVRATAEAMAQFAAAHFLGDERLLSDRMKREAQATQWSIPSGHDEGFECGLGFQIHTLGQQRLIGHDAHVAGHVSATFFDPKAKISVAVMTNCREAPITQIFRSIFQTIDFYQTNMTRPTPQKYNRFSVRAANTLATVEIVAAGEFLAAINPNDWEPFDWLEELSVVDATSLRVITPGSMYNEGEIVRYQFSKGSVRSIRFAGQTFTPMFLGSSIAN